MAKIINLCKNYAVCWALITIGIGFCWALKSLEPNTNKCFMYLEPNKIHKGLACLIPKVGKKVLLRDWDLEV